MSSRPLPPLKTALAAVGFMVLTLDCNSQRGGSSAAPSAATMTPRAALAAPPPPPSIAPLPPDAQTADEKNTIDVFRAAARSVVFVTETRLRVDYFSGRALEVPAGSGTGFVWDTDGHVVTNFHVVKGARSLSVTLQDHRSFPAKIVGVEPRKDIAVLKIEATGAGLSAIRVRKKARPLEVGQKAIAIGNPFGLDQTLTTGVISALGREVDGIGGVSIRDMVQTDAAINPGNSGGPLLDSSGELIGMNTMIFSRSGASAGIGFAVPVTTIARVVPQIIRSGRAEQVGIGIQIDNTRQLERRAGVAGVIVISVVPGSPAAKAGLRGIEQTAAGIRVGDVVVAIGGEPVKDYDDLYNVLDKRRPGETVEVTILRAGKSEKLKMETVALP